MTSARTAPCLWFDRQAEEAAKHYCDIFPNSRITALSRYGEAGREIHGGTPGAVLTVAFELDGQPHLALNGGPQFKFTEAVSLIVYCDSQDEIDHYWSRLSAGGPAAAQQCGWLKDRYGLSWQVVPREIARWMSDPARSDRVMAAVLKMQKIDVATVRQAYEGKSP